MKMTLNNEFLKFLMWCFEDFWRFAALIVLILVSVVWMFGIASVVRAFKGEKD